MTLDPAPRRVLEAALLLDARMQRAPAADEDLRLLGHGRGPLPMSAPRTVIGHQFGQDAFRGHGRRRGGFRRPYRADRLEDGATGLETPVSAVGADAGIGDARLKSTTGPSRPCGRRPPVHQARRPGAGRSAAGRDARRRARPLFKRAEQVEAAAVDGATLTAFEIPRRCLTSATIAWKVSRLTSLPPNRSASDTTPTGRLVHARYGWPGAAYAAGTSTSYLRPPPMSTKRRHRRRARRASRSRIPPAAPRCADRSPPA